MSAQKAKKSLRIPKNFIVNLKFGTVACSCHIQVAFLRSLRFPPGVPLFRHFAKSKVPFLWSPVNAVFFYNEIDSAKFILRKTRKAATRGKTNEVCFE